MATASRSSGSRSIPSDSGFGSSSTFIKTVSGDPLRSGSSFGTGSSLSMGWRSWSEIAEAMSPEELRLTVRVPSSARLTYTVVAAVEPVDVSDLLHVDSPATRL